MSTSTLARRLRRVVIGTFKGGVAKTTTTLILAMAAANAGLRVLVVCTDTVNRGASNWISDAQARGYNIPFEFIQYRPDEHGRLNQFLKATERSRDDIDLFLIDLGGENANSFAVTSAWADWLISPVEPNAGDLAGIPTTYEAAATIADLRARAGDGLFHSILLVCCPAVHKGLARIAREQLADDQRDDDGNPAGDPRWAVGAHVFDTEISRHGNYSGLWGHIPDGLGTDEGRGAIGEYADLWDEMTAGWADAQADLSGDDRRDDDASAPPAGVSDVVHGDRMARSS